MRWVCILMASVLWAGCFGPAQARGPGQPADEAGILLLDQAMATERVPGASASATERLVSLRERWDTRHPGQGGHALYRVSLPPASRSQAMGLLLERVGNQVDVRVNGALVTHLGVLGREDFDASKFPQLVFVPRALLRSDQANKLEVELAVQPLRAGGLSPMRYGPWDSVESLHAARRPWREGAPLAYAVSLALMGGLSGGLWWRQRDAVYGCFSLAALCGAVRNIDRAWLDVPVPWPAWGAIVAICYATHLALIIWFVLLVLGRARRRLVLGVGVALGLAIALSAVSFVLKQAVWWTAGLALLLLMAVLCFADVVRVAGVEKRRLAWVLTVAGGLAIAAGTHDLLRVRMGLLAGIPPILMPHAMFFFVLIMAGIVVERYSRSVLAHRLLNAELMVRVADRERQLTQAYESLQQQREAQLIGVERQRIMREIHDGIGSHLVGLLNLVGQGDARSHVLQEHVQLALDEMRMAVDALQPSCTDLVTVLATLRYRLQPRLAAAGMEVLWDVPSMPDAPPLTPQSVFHVQRILLEAFTNVLKHARATRVTMRAQWLAGEAPGIQLQLTDNGVGLPGERSEAVPGHAHQGLNNMRSRAQAIGAALSLEPGVDGGTCLTLVWPMAAGPT
ncbi:MAG: histidine kinase [Rubrivivax sp.]|nr:MAG: histidine kinase [Rubrivivax sp.]